MDDLCTCGHERDEHADGGGKCLAIIGYWHFFAPGTPQFCHCRHHEHEPEQDDV